MFAFALKSLAIPESKSSLPVRVNIPKSESGREEVFLSPLSLFKVSQWHSTHFSRLAVAAVLGSELGPKSAEG